MPAFGVRIRATRPEAAGAISIAINSTTAGKNIAGFISGL
jgi:hypothetical protein